MDKMRKWIHRTLIDSLLFHPPPLIFILSAVFGLVFCIGYYCAHVIDQFDIAKFKPCSSLYDNIAGVPAKNWMPDIFPVDVVYTWVNGSDPLLLRNLEKYGRTNDNLNRKCSYNNCIYSPYYIIENTADFIQLLHDNDIKILKEVVATKEPSSSDQLVFTFLGDESQDIIANIKSQLKMSCKNKLFWTSDGSVEGAFTWPKTLILSSILPNSSNEHVENHLNEVGKGCTLHYRNNITVYECSELSYETFHSFRNLNSSGVKLWTAYLSNLKKCEEDKDNNAMRYDDNEELRYSLRSVEKYMPWVRKIFIVTNGQIPHWLNLAHSRVNLITHEEIFKDLSHLPTFSSSAIEANIHRIPGLSEHFLYFNDDFLLGAPVSIADFYSPYDGYKVYLSWNLPNCSPNCPPTWINDKYCDKACNTSACEFDGGDCLQDDGLPTIQSTCGMFCWDEKLANSVCDKYCNCTVCGFDGGDCGSDVIRSRLPKLIVPRNSNETVSVPQGKFAAWFDLSSFINESYNAASGNISSSGVRLMSVNATAKMAVLVFKGNFIDSPVVQFEFFKRPMNKSLKVSFKLHYNTFPRTSRKMGSPIPGSVHRKIDPVSYNNSKYSPEFVFKQSDKLEELRRLFLGESSRKLLQKNQEAMQMGDKFLWERRYDLQSSEVSQNAPFRSRRLLDMFSKSLTFVDRLYTEVYGFKGRKVPSHLPYFVNKTILEELINKYPSDFDITSSNKFRSENDMQFSFSYYHYIMEETNTRTLHEMFSLFDTDHSGTWADRELKTFMLKSTVLFADSNDPRAVYEELKNCSRYVEQINVPTRRYERYPDSDLPTITEELIANCPNSTIKTRLKEIYEKVGKFKYTIASDSNLHFTRIFSNINKAVRSLDDLRKRDRKFICINNDMDLNSEDNEIVKALILDYFESVLPIHSSFELPDYYRNKFSHVAGLRDWKWRRNLFKALILASVSSLCFVLVLTCFHKQIEVTKRRWCRHRRKITCVWYPPFLLSK